MEPLIIGGFGFKVNLHTFSHIVVMSRKTSSVWEHFSLVSGTKAKCHLCKKVLAYKGSSTSNLNKHLQLHPSVNPAKKKRKKCDDIDDIDDTDDTDDDLLEVGNASTSGAAVVPATNESAVMPGATDSTASTAASTTVIAADRATPSTLGSTSKQTKMTGYIRRELTPLQKSKVDMAVLKVVVGDLQPFSIVQDKAFKALVQLLEPNYVLPCRTTICRTLLPRKYESMVEKVKELIEGIEAMSLTTDMWTARTTQAYIAVTGHYVTKQWTMGSVMLGCIGVTGSHTAVMIRDELLQVRIFF